ncbi:amino acid/amide ABC transporter substrate-binding protein, HAAT family (TC 3.A.1.4.-) [Aliiroseovarius halocynthiae]|uniref:ABC transporter substrate-binding protein n=1 Tax=Aliiroseovarius halocynthiae TaxID=985055 RepID=A0A545SW18_9RHOB|nr:ABC transporter substrate-binding protein [Aliiroseovarius halocynthiae]TQV69158.1 ABC transporter substrate-binding protein [Aliiroseovarius halocynthiae]SMR71918.1 amino acid/amide ABC transporter substrate-binding protein, HAAT family (TC 3.A.1.4.-) [Aliiroseovarius halocynthiae]
MKKLLLATAATALTCGAAFADDHAVKIGVLLGFTGPLESLAPPIAGGAEAAIAEVSASGTFMGGKEVMAIRGDSTCVDSAAATAAAERLVTGDGVAGIVGAMCSGATGAVLTGVSMPNGVAQVSPSATSPALSTLEDNGLFFRLAPSDARQGELMADIIMGKGVKSVALTYTNNDYGKGLADSFAAAFEAAGGTVTINAAHEDGKADYSAEVGALASAGGDALVVAGYSDQGGAGVIQGALDSGAFDLFVLPDGMVSDALTEKFGSDLDGSFGQHPASKTDGAGKLEALLADAGIDGASVYAKEGYDSAAVLLLGMHKAGTTDGAAVAAAITEVANAPGEPIGPGELAKALEILSNGGDIDYVGGSDVELVGPGESGGSFREVVIEGGEFKEVGFH